MWVGGGGLRAERGGGVGGRLDLAAALRGGVGAWGAW